MLQLILMFLLACAALPDEERDRLDLAVYYEQNRQYFWTLFSLVAFMAVLTNLVVTIQAEPPSTLFLKAIPNLLYAVACCHWRLCVPRLSMLDSSFSYSLSWYWVGFRCGSNEQYSHRVVRYEHA